MKKLLYLFLFGLLPIVSWSQTTPMGTPLMEEYMRRQQLLGNLDPSVSFNIRPLYPRQAFGFENAVDLDSTFTSTESEYHKPLGTKGRMIMMPAVVRSQFNSNYAFGNNDGPMIPNRGLQTHATVGIYAEYGRFSLQVQPDLIHAQNREYQGFPEEHWGSTWQEYYDFLNMIDQPERYGNGPYTMFFLGQSSLRFNMEHLSIGISSESLWWGPSKRHSLMMSNNAPGFLHLTLNTRKPIETNIGSFEGQVIAGRLESSGFLPPNHLLSERYQMLYHPKRDDEWRYLAGIILSYQPKWVKGLSLGYSSVSQMYWNDMDRFGDFLPIFNGDKRARSVSSPAVDRRQQMSTGFFRWMMPEGHFEFYGEYGSNGNSKRLREFIVNPDEGRAFTLGFVNLHPLSKKDQFLQVHMEMTLTGQTVRRGIREMNSWYIHPHVRHGYTHHGQVLGAGNGTGSNTFFGELSWIKNFNRIGFQLEHITYNNDFYYKRFEIIKDFRRKYVDIVPSLVADWRFGNVLLSSRFQYVNTLNYKWYLENDPDFYMTPGLDRKNFVANVGVAYIFK
ncbi:hypothetical protein KI659_16805 [Litoribacter alkaliphilus]|uniref:Capsule assembly protein Wzi n=1 Tax=Litoribacter ruber TaxID=702568 RepID=A0AAP2G640_9BACT|nr:capsule assembly Wzi family protein [Litoribacter alkaliphilus]MBS9525681.1 hypothetical protein [Litoribacter alkaliphilus]